MDANVLLAWGEQLLGAALILFVLVDVFLTVLYARIGVGILSRRLAHVTWIAFRWVSSPFKEKRGRILSFCGPLILVLLVAVWGAVLICGTGLMVHPHLGEAVKLTDGPTPTDFVSALFAGGTSVGILGSSDFAPKTSAFRLLFLFNSLAGMSAISLTLTYIIQVYRALQERNGYALKMHLASGRRADAAEMVAGMGPEGRFDIGYGTLAEAAAELIHVKESHHLYPVLFYFRFAEPLYSVSRFTLVTFDAVTLIKSALDDEAYAWLKKSGSLEQLWGSSMLLVTTLNDAFVPNTSSEHKESPNEEDMVRWRRRFHLALNRLREAGIKTVADEEAGADRYVTLRSEWHPQICDLAPAMGYAAEEIDPIGYHADSSHP